MRRGLCALQPPTAFAPFSHPPRPPRALTRTRQGSPIILPDGVESIHHEVELGVVISRRCKNVGERQVLPASVHVHVCPARVCVLSVSRSCARSYRTFRNYLCVQAFENVAGYCVALDMTARCWYRAFRAACTCPACK